MNAKRCQAHFNELPCTQCSENERRGYAVLMLAGRCANGSELDSGTRWHAVRPDEYKAVCGAQPGRRSAGWSSYTVLGQKVTCPRCEKKLSPASRKHIVMVQHADGKQDIDPDLQWAGRTVYLTTTVDNGFEPDALIEHSTPDTVAEARADVKHDLDWFGVKQGFKVTCRISIDNVFEEISEYDPKASQRWPTDAEREAWKQEAEATGARLAQTMAEDYRNWQDQTDDHDDFNGIIKTIHFDGTCPFLTCLEVGPHDHSICPECGAVRYGNIYCKTCREARRSEIINGIIEASIDLEDTPRDWQNMRGDCAL